MRVGRNAVASHSSLFLSLGIIGSLAALVSSSRVDAEIESASTRGSVGDISNLLISPEGFMIDVMNNDFMGSTDKYMTGETKAGFLRLFPDHAHGYVSSFDFNVYWRAITPADYDKFGGNPLRMQVGRFADWLDSEMAYARTYRFEKGWRIKYQGVIGPGHIGNKGARTTQIAIHKFTGNPTANLTYDDQDYGITFRHGFSIGLIPPSVMDGVDMMGSVGYNNDEAMKDLYIQFNVIAKISSWLSLGTELSANRQISSNMYGLGIDLARYEAAAAMRVCHFYQPSVKWVSNYLRGDQVPQVYLEFLRFNIPL